MSENTLNLIKESEARWIDMRFTDFKGKEQHLTIPVSDMGDEFFEDGKMFDGSSIAGWKGINESDMILMPDDSASVLDPFAEDATVIVRCACRHVKIGPASPSLLLLPSCSLPLLSPSPL